MVFEFPAYTRSSVPLKTSAKNVQLDLSNWVGQRTASFIFRRVHGVTGEPLGRLYPLRSPVPTLTHDSTRTIKRQLGISLGVDDAALIDPLTERVTVAMLVGGVEYPLGRYAYTDQSRLKYTVGEIASLTLLDEMFIIDQQLDTAFSATTRYGSQTVPHALTLFTSTLNVTLTIEASTLIATGSWNAGTTRGQVIETLATQGDYFSPWFGNDTNMHFVRSFDPVTATPTFDWDNGNVVFLGSVVETSDLLTAPNRFVVISNSGDAAAAPIVGTYDVPSSAPHSIQNRGFVIPSVEDIQLTTPAQAASVARNLGIQQTIFERREIVTAIDPRHDGYDVIRWDGENWLEISWSMTLLEGEGMSHLLRKAYR